MDILRLVYPVPGRPGMLARSLVLAAASSAGWHIMLVDWRVSLVTWRLRRPTLSSQIPTQHDDNRRSNNDLD